MTDAIIIAARRTPIARVGRSLKLLTADRLLVPVLQALLTDTGLTASAIDEVVIGNAVGGGGNLARLACLSAGFPASVPGVTIDRQCGSGLEAIQLGARLVQAGAAEAVIAGGVESVSTAPWRIEKPRSLYELPRFADRARFAPEAVGDPDMGIAAENVARQQQISRDRQDAYALHSHQKAVAAMQSGRFKREIVPVPISDQTIVEVDECPRANLTLARLSRLPPAFVPDGTVTVGNSCPINDGAAAVLIVSESRFRSLQLQRGLRFVDAAAAGVDPNLLGMAPIPAVQKLLQRQSLSADQIDLVEFNEAFAAQVLACLDALNLPPAKVNRGGGAIALGHPYGASGAILVTRLFAELEQSGQRGLATLGIAGGLGIAALFERL